MRLKLKKNSVRFMSTLLLGLFIAANVQAYSSNLQVNGLKTKVLNLALHAYDCARLDGQIKNPILSIVDYSLPSTQARLWVIDMEQHKVLYHLFVAHGKNSGKLYATHFSNEPGSLASSLGSFVTHETYQGHHGYSLSLEGLEPGLNDKARERHIILHGAPYVSKQFAAHNNYMGRSWGCLALNPSKTPQVINTIKGGSLIFAYAPGEEHDPYLNQCGIKGHAT